MYNCVYISRRPFKVDVLALLSRIGFSHLSISPAPLLVLVLVVVVVVVVVVLLVGGFEYGG